MMNFNVKPIVLGIKDFERNLQHYSKHTIKYFMNLGFQFQRLSTRSVREAKNTSFEIDFEVVNREFSRMLERGYNLNGEMLDYLLGLEDVSYSFSNANKNPIIIVATRSTNLTYLTRALNRTSKKDVKKKYTGITYRDSETPIMFYIMERMTQYGRIPVEEPDFIDKFDTLVKTVIKRGGDIDAANQQGTRPIDLAVARDLKVAVVILMKNGSKVPEIGSMGRGLIKLLKDEKLL